MLNQDAPHHLGGNREEMGAILPPHALVVDQSHVGFIEQRGRLQAGAGALAPHVAPRQPVELVIDDGRQPFERALLSVAPGLEQLAHLAPGCFAGLWRPRHPFGHLDCSGAMIVFALLLRLPQWCLFSPVSKGRTSALGLVMQALVSPQTESEVKVKRYASVTRKRRRGGSRLKGKS